MAILSKAMLLAGAVGVAAAVFGNIEFLKRVGDEVPVTVAAHTIEPDTVITPSDWTTVSVPKGAVHPDCVAVPTGRLTVLGIPKGDQIRSAALAPQNSLLQYANAQGEVLVSVSVVEDPVSELVQPGTSVTLLVNGTLLHGVQVLSTGGTRTTIASAAGNALGTGSGPNTGKWLVMATWGEAQTLEGQTATVILGDVPPGATWGSPATTTTVPSSPVPTNEPSGTSVPSSSDGATSTVAEPPASLNSSPSLPLPGFTVTTKGVPSHAVQAAKRSKR